MEASQAEPCDRTTSPSSGRGAVDDRCIESHRRQIEAGLGSAVLNVVMEELSHFLAALRICLSRTLEPDGRRGRNQRGGRRPRRMVAGTVGTTPVPGGRRRPERRDLDPAVVGVTKSAKTVTFARQSGIKRKRLDAKLAVRCVVWGPEEVQRSSGLLAVNASEIFS